MVYEQIVVEVEDRVATITLNRPEKRNALSIALRDEIRDFMATQMAPLHAVVVTGAGTGFCAGMDLDETLGFGEANEQWSFFKSIYDCDTVFIAAVNGPARGAGMTLIAACDLAIADPSATFGLPEIGHGFYGSVASPMVQLATNTKIAAEMVLTGQPISAEKAEQACLVNRLAAPGALMADAKAIAQHLSGLNRETLATAKRALRTVPFDADDRQHAVDNANALNRKQFPHHKE